MSLSDLLPYLSIGDTGSRQRHPSAFQESFSLASRQQGMVRESAKADCPSAITRVQLTRSGRKRIIVKEVNWLGDLVMSLPALRAVRSSLSTSSLSVLVRHDLAGFFDGIGWVDEVIPYSMRRGVAGLLDQIRIIATLRARRFDLAIIFPNSFRSALWMMLAGVLRRAGYSTDGRGFLLTDRAMPNASAKNGHQRFYWLEMVHDTLGIWPAADIEYKPLEVSPQRAARMREFLDARRRTPQAPLIAISPIAAYGPAKEWSPQRFAELIDLLGKFAGAECVLLGTVSDRSKCQQVAAMSRKGAIVAAGETDVAELKALLSVCDGFAGNDSGAMHLAAAIGIPAVGVFGSTNPLRTGPVGVKATVIYHPVECSPCLQRTCRFGHYRCLHSVAPAEVAETLAQLGAFKNARSAALR
ncbi:MAG: lipopolysaccharide heptosyltransferase II [Deltaproteobacteria bacterium]|nr:lipopolysaccharide heptosyltransferase II [Deltaproteobacteria bacterium]